MENPRQFRTELLASRNPALMRVCEAGLQIRNCRPLAPAIRRVCPVSNRLPCKLSSYRSINSEARRCEAACLDSLAHVAGSGRLSLALLQEACLRGTCQRLTSLIDSLRLAGVFLALRD